MNRRVKPLLLQRAIKMQLHVARSFEFFKDKLVHAATCFHQSSREHSEAPAFFDISGGAEKFLWLDKRLCFDAARHDAAFAGLQVIIASRKPGETIEQKHNVLFEF